MSSAKKASPAKVTDREMDSVDLARLRQPPPHPGEIFEEQFRRPSGLSQAEAARRMGIPRRG